MFCNTPMNKASNSVILSTFVTSMRQPLSSIHLTVPAFRHLMPSRIYLAPFKLNHVGRASRKPSIRRSMITRAEVKFVDSKEAEELVRLGGYVIMDVRDKTQYERAHIKICYHVPLFVENTDNDFGTIVKRTVHNNFSGLFFGLPFTKPNPDFIGSVKKSFTLDSKILLVCQEGLRSAAATNRLEEEGFQNVACLTSGLQTVKPGAFESVGSTELQNAGKAGLVTIQGKISAVLGTVLICAYLFITLFPEQAEKLLQLAPGS